jgi:hypothetical protein
MWWIYPRPHGNAGANRKSNIGANGRRVLEDFIGQQAVISGTLNWLLMPVGLR